jgi:hypothetical protein
VDEAQNLTPHEVKTIITRAGEGTKVVFTGDIHQIDHPTSTRCPTAELPDQPHGGPVAVRPRHAGEGRTVGTGRSGQPGLLEEIQLENLYRNTSLAYPVWDTVLYEKARFQPGLDLRLSCAVCEVECDGPRIAFVRAWNLTGQRWVRVAARLFIDASGDSILRLSGAPCRWGREARAEFGELLAPEQADRKTMGNSILLQLREIDPADHHPFIAPAWAHTFTEADFSERPARPTGHNFWWLEIGGEGDTIADADAIRDDLLAMAMGAWAYIKNHPDGRGHAWDLEWIGALPGKRENVRYIGAHTLTQMDIQSGGGFDDRVAYGGWTIDDHPPGGFRHPGSPTQHAQVPSPYGIPFGCLYGTAVPNLLFPGRNLSATHLGMSSTRVMGTLALTGQAAGTAAALAIRHGVEPAEVHARHLRELQQTLMDDDVWLPGFRRPIPEPTVRARLTASAGDPEPLRDGVDRPLGEEAHGWDAAPGAWAALDFGAPVAFGRVRLVFDSRLSQRHRMPCSYPRRGHTVWLPGELVRAFRVQVTADGAHWEDAVCETDNRRRLVHLDVPGAWRGVRLVIDRAWGPDAARVFSFEAGCAPPPTAFEPVAWPVYGARSGTA